MRNSSFEFTVVVLTKEVLLPVMASLDVADGFALSGAAVEEAVIVVGRSAGEVPGACWMSLPCSAISVGPRLGSSLRSCGMILERMRSFTGCFELASAWMSISNYIQMKSQLSKGHD